jgi:hypothetical protein
MSCWTRGLTLWIIWLLIPETLVFDNYRWGFLDPDRLMVIFFLITRSGYSAFLCALLSEGSSWSLKKIPTGFFQFMDFGRYMLSGLWNENPPGFSDRFLTSIRWSFFMILGAGTRSNPVTWGIQVDTDLMGNPGVTFRVLLELFPAIVTAEIVFLVLVFARILCTVFINDGQTDWIGCHSRFSWCTMRPAC